MRELAVYDYKNFYCYRALSENALYFFVKRLLTKDIQVYILNIYNNYCGKE